MIRRVGWPMYVKYNMIGRVGWPMYALSKVPTAKESASVEYFSLPDGSREAAKQTFFWWLGEQVNALISTSIGGVHIPHYLDLADMIDG